MMLLLEAALHSFALGAAVWIGLKVLRVENPHVEMMVWKLVLVASLAMPLLLPWTTVRLPDWPLPALMEGGSGNTLSPTAEPQSVAVPNVPDAGAARPERSAPSPDPAPPPAGSPAEGSTGATPRPFFAVPGWMVLVTDLYLLVSGALLLQLLTGIVLIFRLSRTARPFRADWTAGAHVRVSEAVAMPVTFASTILLPANCQSWPALKERAVISHEKSHIERNDFYWLLIAALHRVVFWFNPLAWSLMRRLGELMEMLSDDAAIEDLGDAPAYAEILLDVARNVRPTPAAIAMAQSRTMAWRIDRILRTSAIPVRPSAGKRLLVAAGVLPLVGLSAVGIVHGAAAGTEEPTVIDTQTLPPSRPASAGDTESELNDMFARLFVDSVGSRAAVPIDPATFDRYAGAFRIDSGFILTLTREGDQFFAQLTGQPKVRIYPQSETDFFFATAIDAWISFRPGGQTDWLIFHQNGRDSAARHVDVAEAHAAESAFQQQRAAAEGRRPAATAAASSAGPYVGFYEADPTNVLVITREGQQLFGQLTGQRRLPVFPAGGSEYTYGAADARVTFVTEGDSLASELVLHLKGRDLHLPRVADLPNPAAGHVNVDPGLFNLYIGTYQVDLKTVVVITRGDDGVFVKESGQSKVEVIPHNLDDYMSRDGRVQIVFSRDISGRAKGLILYDQARGAEQATKLVLDDHRTLRDGDVRQVPKPRKERQ